MAVKDSRKECQEDHEGDEPPKNGRLDDHEGAAQRQGTKKSQVSTAGRNDKSSRTLPRGKGRKGDDVYVLK